MELIKISLADAAKARECSIDYLLALAEAGQLHIYARIGPYAVEFKNKRGEPPSVPDARHGKLTLTGPTAVGVPGYTTLLPHEAAILRTGKAVTVRVVREPGAENGVRFPFSGDEEFSMHLTEPQVVVADQVCVIEASKTASPVVAPKPVQRGPAQEAAILSEIRALGWNPNALPVPTEGLAGPRAGVYASMVGRDVATTRAVFSSKKVFETAWQRMRNAGQICDAQPTLVEPQKKSGLQGG